MLVTPVDRERPGRHRAAEPRGERQHPAADAGVDVAADAALGGQRGDLGDRVDDAVRVRRRAGHHEHRVVVDRRRHRGGVGTEVRADRHRAPPRRRSSAAALWKAACAVVGQHHARGRSTSGRASRAALHGQQHRLGAAGGHRADHAVRRVEQVGGEADQVVLHRQQARERRGVEAVGAGVRRHRLAADLVDLVEPGVVDVGQGAAAVHRQVVGAAARRAGGARRVSGTPCQRTDIHLRGVEGVAAQPPQAEQR